MNSCLIVIPIYKKELSYFENVSICRIIEVCEETPIELIAPFELDITCYIKIFNESKCKFSIKYFNKRYFNSISGYNKLLMKPFFYKGFINYKYILIYQLDAFIFDFNIQEWCDKDFDFIGAPWFNIEKTKSFYDKLTTSSNIVMSYLKKKIDYNKGAKIKVGNGGLSLRKVKIFYSISRWLPFIEPGIFKYKNNEDLVWSVLVPKFFKKFNVPDFEDALRFSIEDNPEKGLSILGDNLPFGCHAWEKYDIKVWRPIFKKYGYYI